MATIGQEGGPKSYRTTVDNDHDHTFTLKSKETSRDMNHTHRLLRENGKIVGMTYDNGHSHGLPKL